LHAAAGQVQHAAAVGAELRRLAVVGHLDRLATGRRHHVDATVTGPQAAGQAAAARARVDHLLAVRGEARVVVEARLPGELASRRAAAGAADVDRAQALVAPGGVEHLPAVGAEAGLVLVDALASGQAARLAFRKRLAPQRAQGVEHHRAAVCGGRDVADHLRCELALVDAALESQRLDDLLLDLRGEGDPACLAAAHVDAPDPALGPDHDRLRVRRPA